MRNMRTSALAGALITMGVCACNASQPTQEAQMPPVRQGYVMQLPAVGIGDRDGLLLPMMYNLSPILPGPTPYDGTDAWVADALELVRTESGLALLGNRLERAEVVGPKSLKKRDGISERWYDVSNQCYRKKGEPVDLWPMGSNQSNHESRGDVCVSRLTVFTSTGSYDCTPKTGTLADPRKLRVMENIHYDPTSQRALLDGGAGAYALGISGLTEIDCNSGASYPLRWGTDAIDLSDYGASEICMMNDIGRVLFFGYSASGGDNDTTHFMAYATETRRLVDLLPPRVGQEQVSCETGLIAAVSMRSENGEFVFPYTYDVVAVDVREALTSGDVKLYRWEVRFSEFAEGEAYSYQVKPEAGAAVEYHSTFFASTVLRERKDK